jgi:threonine dehydrogenase-like Zn-dependent dehydrogenase
MKALVYYGPRDLRYEDRPIPVPKKGEALIKVKAVSICGSDLGAYKLPEISERWKPPIVLGHEFSGEIAELGEGVKGFQTGQAVTANPILYCGDCYYCKQGKINLCPNRYSLGTSIGGVAHDGGMQEYLTIRASALYPLEEGITFEQGALMEPLAVSLCAARTGDCGDNETVAVIGAGPIGLMIVKFLVSFGKKKIIVSDILPERLEMAKRIGAHETIDGRMDIVSRIKELTNNIGVNRVLIAAGVPDIINKSFEMVCNGGKIVLVALMHQNVQIDPMQIVSRGVSLIGSYMFTDEIRDVMDDVAKKRIIVDDLITAVYPLKDGVAILKDLCEPCAENIKVILKP